MARRNYPIDHEKVKHLYKIGVPVHVIALRVGSTPRTICKILGVEDRSPTGKQSELFWK